MILMNVYDFYDFPIGGVAHKLVMMMNVDECRMTGELRDIVAHNRTQGGVRQSRGEGRAGNRERGPGQTTGEDAQGLEISSA